MPYTPHQMYGLVDNISAYPLFLPWCVSAKEHSRDSHAVVASIELSKGALKKSFTTRNSLTPDEEIEIHLVEGPFKRLEGNWRFQPLKQGAACKVLLDLDFEFSSRLIDAALGPVFGSIANSLVDAFVERARSVFGPQKGVGS